MTIKKKSSPLKQERKTAGQWDCVSLIPYFFFFKVILKNWSLTFRFKFLWCFFFFGKSSKKKNSASVKHNNKMIWGTLGSTIIKKNASERFGHLSNTEEQQQLAPVPHSIEGGGFCCCWAWRDIRERICCCCSCCCHRFIEFRVPDCHRHDANNAGFIYITSHNDQLSFFFCFGEIPQMALLLIIDL